jgi:hypothetical protein
MAYKINIAVAGQPGGTPGDYVILPYTVIDGAAPLVTLTLVDSTGVESYFWEFISRPVDSTAVIQNATTSTATFTPDQNLPGTYLIRCKINGDQSIARNGVAFKTEVMDVRIPSAQETTQFDSVIGWDGAMQDFIRKVDAQILTAGEIYWDRFDGSGSGGVGYYLTPDLSERVSIPAGTKEAPSMVFDNDIDTGFWSPSSGIVSMSIGGDPAVRFRRSDIEDAVYIETYDVDSSTDEFHISHVSSIPSVKAKLYLESESVSTGGAQASITSTGTSVGTSSVQISAINGSATLLSIASANSVGGAASLDLVSESVDVSDMHIKSHSLGSGWATLRISSESDLYGASLILGCKGALGASDDEGIIQIGEYDTGKIAFLSSDIYASGSWTDDYLYLIKDFSELDTFYSKYGDSSIIAAINSSGISGLVEDELIFGDAVGSVDSSSDLTWDGNLHVGTDVYATDYFGDSLVKATTGDEDLYLACSNGPDYAEIDLTVTTSSEFSGISIAAYSSHGETGSASLALSASVSGAVGNPSIVMQSGSGIEEKITVSAAALEFTSVYDVIMDVGDDLTVTVDSDYSLTANSVAISSATNVSFLNSEVRGFASISYNKNLISSSSGVVPAIDFGETSRVHITVSENITSFGVWTAANSSGMEDNLIVLRFVGSYSVSGFPATVKFEGSSSISGNSGDVYVIKISMVAESFLRFYCEVRGPYTY